MSALAPNLTTADPTYDWASLRPTRRIPASLAAADGERRAMHELHARAAEELANLTGIEEPILYETVLANLDAAACLLEIAEARYREVWQACQSAGIVEEHAISLLAEALA